MLTEIVECNIIIIGYMYDFHLKDVSKIKVTRR